MFGRPTTPTPPPVPELDRPYRRWIEGSSISLEANTSSTPLEGNYYVFQDGVVFFVSENLSEAEEVFIRLRICHWEALLASRDPQQRLDGARGLCRHDAGHTRALEILVADGDDRDLKQVARTRQRARYSARAER